MLLVNGKPGAALPIGDRGLQYGDGLFETIEVSSQRPVFFERHLKRLENGCQRLGIPYPGVDLLTEEAAALCRQAAPQAVLKIIVTAGSGGRGYRRPDAPQATRILSLHPHPEYPANLADEGIVARFCATRLGLNPALAGIKHLNRLEQVLARAEWRDPAIQEGLMLDTEGRVIEGTMSNLFYVSSQTLRTPALHQTGIAGVMRGLLIDLAKKHGLAVDEFDVTPERLLAADECFVCNSIIGIWPLKQIDRTTFQPGPITRKLQQWLADHKQAVTASEQ